MIAKKRPSAVYVIYAVEFLTTASYGVFLSTLALYFVHEQTNIISAFTTVSGFICLSAIVGIICGTFIGNYLRLSTALNLGVLLSLCSFLLLDIHEPRIRLIALSINILSTGLYIPSLRVLLNHQFETEVSRNQGVHINYILMNLGALFGYLFVGIFLEQLFFCVNLFCIITNVLALMILLISYNQYQMDDGETKLVIIAPSLLLLCLMIFLLLEYPIILMIVMMVAAVISISTIILLYFKEMNNGYLKYLVIVGVAGITFHIVNTFYYTAYGMLIFSRFTHDISPTWFFSINPITVFIFGGVFSFFYTKYQPNPITKIIVGMVLMLISISALLVPMEINQNHPGGIQWLIINITLLSFAEFLILPTILAETHNLIPRQYHSLFMGFARGFRGLAAIVTGLVLVKFSDKLHMIKIMDIKKHYFIHAFWVLFSIVLVTLLLMIFISNRVRLKDGDSELPPF